MKSFIFGVFRTIWAIIRVALIVVGSIGAVLSVILFCICILGLFLNAIISGWDKAFDLTLLPLLISIGCVFGFSLMRAIGNFSTNNE